jgi:hypothetical protein
MRSLCMCLFWKTRGTGESGRRRKRGRKEGGCDVIVFDTVACLLSIFIPLNYFRNLRQSPNHCRRSSLFPFDQSICPPETAFCPIHPDCLHTHSPRPNNINWVFTHQPDLPAFLHFPSQPFAQAFRIPLAPACTSLSPRP